MGTFVKCCKVVNLHQIGETGKSNNTHVDEIMNLVASVLFTCVFLR